MRRRVTTIVAPLLLFACTSLLTARLESVHAATCTCSTTRLYWTTGGGQIFRTDPSTPGGSATPVYTSVNSLRGLDHHPSSCNLIWVDQAHGRIDDLFEETSVVGLTTPQDVAVDLASGKIYWTDSGGTDRIGRANLDGTNVETIIGSGLFGVRGIVVDDVEGKIYWTEVEAGGDGIYRANLDGSGVETVVPGLVFPVGIAIDGSAGKIYWTDSGTLKIQRANLDGSGVEDLVTTGLIDPRFLVLDPVTGKMYWTDRGTQLVQRANLDGTQVETVGTSPDPQGIDLHPYRPFAAAYTSLPHVENSSVAWGDYDSDGQLDVALCGQNASGRISRVYRNIGGGSFALTVALPGVSSGVIAWGDYDNDDDLDLLLAGAVDGSTRIARVYRNDGNNTFVDVGAGLTGVYLASGAWGDYDNDGDLDILLAGFTGGVRISRVYRNDGQDVFTDALAGLTGVSFASCAWGDYDRDGDLDIALAGADGFAPVTIVYRNTSGSFANAGAGLPGVESGVVAWGDFDASGDLDLLLAGNTGTSRIARIYEYDGAAFTDAGAGLDGVFFASAAWADWNHDGGLDLLLSGTDVNEPPATRVYRNSGGGAFESAGGLLPGVQRGAGAWGDYDNDGDLDLLVSGNHGGRPLTRLLRGECVSSNTPPTPPKGLVAYPGGSGITFEWSPGSDMETYPDGLSYNLRVGTSPGAGDVLSGMSDPETGQRRIAAPGNAGERLRWTLDLPPSGHYYWSVQTVDGSLAASTFAAEAEFCPFVEVEADFAGVDNNSVAWGDYDADGDLDILVGSSRDQPLSIPRVYRNDDGSFTDVEAGLTGGWLGKSAWGDFDNDGDLDLLISGERAGIPASTVYRNVGGDSFVDVSAGLVGLSGSAVAWGDYDNDMDLDILISGSLSAYPNGPAGWSLDSQRNAVAAESLVTRIYRNDGSGVFTPSPAVLPGLLYGSLAWGDYDGDGDLDILMAGESETGGMTAVYRNDGGDTFQPASLGAPLPPYTNPSVAWADADNDGDVDFAIVGRRGTATELAVYRLQSGLLVDTEREASFGVEYGELTWGDYNNDGVRDLLVGGFRSPPLATRIYRTGAQGTLHPVDVGMPSLASATVAWGDYDDDGDLDALVGGVGPGWVTRLYRNDGCSPVNTPPSAPPGVAVAVNGKSIEVFWTGAGATDVETPVPGLTYNVRIGTSAGSGNLLSGMSLPGTGFRQVPAHGNAGHRSSWEYLSPPILATVCVSVQAVDAANASSAFSQELCIQANVAADPGSLDYAIQPPQPSPFVESTVVRFSQPEEGRVSLSIHDVAGRRVRRLLDAELPPGAYSTAWDGRNDAGSALGSGVYFIRFLAGGVVRTERIAIAR